MKDCPDCQGLKKFWSQVLDKTVFAVLILGVFAYSVLYPIINGLRSDLQKEIDERAWRPGDGHKFISIDGDMEPHFKYLKNIDSSDQILTAKPMESK